MSSEMTSASRTIYQRTKMSPKLAEPKVKESQVPESLQLSTHTNWTMTRGWRAGGRPGGGGGFQHWEVGNRRFFCTVFKLASYPLGEEALRKQVCAHQLWSPSAWITSAPLAHFPLKLS